MRNPFKSKVTLAAFAVCLAAVSSLALASQTQQRAVFAQDKGKFTIQLDGQTVGHEEFEISPAGGGWAAQSTTDLKVPDAPASRVTGTLTLQPDGAPISYEWKSQAEKTNGAHVAFSSGVAKITLEMQGAKPCTAAEIADPHRTQPCFFEQTRLQLVEARHPDFSRAHPSGIGARHHHCTIHWVDHRQRQDLRRPQGQQFRCRGAALPRFESPPDAPRGPRRKSFRVPRLGITGSDRKKEDAA